MIEYDWYVDPAQVVTVTVRPDLGAPVEYHAIVCRYTVVETPAGKRIALELSVDPDVPAPVAPYYCPGSRIVRHRFDPRAIVRIRPFGSV